MARDTTGEVRSRAKIEDRPRPAKQRRLNSTVIDLDPTPEPKPEPAAEVVTKAIDPNVLNAYPSPSSTASPPPRSRRYRLDRNRPLPSLPPLPPYCRPVLPFGPDTVNEYEDGSDDSGETVYDIEHALSQPHDFPPTDKERMFSETFPWYGSDDIFPPPGRPPRASSSLNVPPSPGPMVAGFAHDKPNDDRWRALAPELDLASYNPPRPPAGRTFTKEAKRAFLVEQERCVDLTPLEADTDVWTRQEMAELQARPRRREWYDSGGRTKRLEDCLVDIMRPSPSTWHGGREDLRG